MKATILAPRLAACLVLGWLTAAQAEVPNGTHRVSFPASLTLVDPSGDYSETLSGISVDLTLVGDLAGKITGTGLAHGSLMGVRVNVPLTCTGSLSGNNKTPRMSLTIKGTGSATAQGMRFPMTLDVSFSGPYNPANNEFVGTGKTKACVTVNRKKQCESESGKNYFEPELGIVAIGATASLRTDAKPGKDGKTVGTGTVSLAEGRSFPNFKVTGKYVAKRDETQLTFAASDRSGAKLTFTGQAASGVVQKTKGSGKLLGQSLKW